MSVTYTKLFSSITESTVWCEPDRTRLVWITILAMADKKGRVWASIPGLANRARVPVEDCRKAIETFMAPDLDSRTPEHDGRRLDVIDGGWVLFNYSKYREMRDDETRAEQNRVAQANYRSKHSLLTVSHGKPQSAQAEAEAEAEAVKPKNKYKAKTSAQAPFVLPEWVPEEHWQAWVESRTKARKAPTDYAKRLAVLKLKNLKEQGYPPVQVLMQSAFNNWSGLFPVKEPK